MPDLTIRFEGPRANSGKAEYAAWLTEFGGVADFNLHMTCEDMELSASVNRNKSTPDLVVINAE